MGVQLRYCERCGVIIPVDPAEETRGRYVCDNCRALGEVATPPLAVKAAGGRGSSYDAPVEESSGLAETRPVLRSPTPQDYAREAARQAGNARRRSGALGAAIMVLAILLPVVAGGAVLACTLRGRGFAVRGAAAEPLEAMGAHAIRGADRLEGILAARPPR
jgi:hypothetical protein